MGWEQRLREMILAGGALAATVGCSSSGQVAASNDASVSGSSSGSGSGGSGSGGGSSGGCCNAASDPCCEFLNCGAPLTPQCSCQLDGGAWTYSSATGEETCDLPPGNGGSSGGACCNANGDPCCEFLYCGGSMDPICACELDGGTSEYTPGNEGGTIVTCTFPQDAGQDAGD
jgi:hypothetical protein